MKKIVYKCKNVFLKKMLQHALEEFEFIVDCIEEDEDMFEILKNEKIDLVIYDIEISFPELVFKQIKDLSPKTKMTVSANINHPHQLMNLMKFNMHPFINKPFNDAQILKTISHYLLEEGEELKVNIKQKDLTQFMYKRDDEGNIEGIHFEYQSDHFFVIFEYDKDEITNVYINHHLNMMFTCSACGGQSIGMEECKELSPRTDEILDILFNIEDVRNVCKSLIPKWETYLLKTR